MATGVNQVESDPIDGDALNIGAQGADGSVHWAISRSGDRIIIDMTNGTDGLQLTFHNREALNNFVQALQKAYNV